MIGVYYADDRPIADPKEVIDPFGSQLDGSYGLINEEKVIVGQCEILIDYAYFFAAADGSELKNPFLIQIQHMCHPFCKSKLLHILVQHQPLPVNLPHLSLQKKLFFSEL